MGTERLCLTCGEALPLSSHGKRKYCSTPCVPSYRNAKAPEYETSKRRCYCILERDAFRCVYCGRSSVEDGVTLHVDHVVPRISGGADVAGNMVTACKECNLSKSGKRLDESLERRVLDEVAARNASVGLRADCVIKGTVGRDC